MNFQIVITGAVFFLAGILSYVLGYFAKIGGADWTIISWAGPLMIAGIVIIVIGYSVKS